MQKYPLRPFIIVGVGRVDFAVPIVAKSERFNLSREVFDVLFRRLAWVRARLDGVLLGGQTKRIPTDRVQDVEALHAFVARNDVGRRVALGVPDVQARARRIRKHVEDVVFRFRRPIDSPKTLVFLPILLPFGFDFTWVICAHVASCSVLLNSMSLFVAIRRNSSSFIAMCCDVSRGVEASRFLLGPSIALWAIRQADAPMSLVAPYGAFVAPMSLIAPYGAPDVVSKS